eukprot:CAMPEP_0194334122 /NCGR_PEP_ID=MMETSP0171-20130528/65054_1 /TAXON_ID=218684 /ORGANISM="Corethron pennatum, Strain L29A3" /LENGTH=311 /DNA_ID=CAMNT_0039096647 /DNA_START=34 /DNA_END=965 /DNA_ORIENTATION=+
MSVVLRISSLLLLFPAAARAGSTTSMMELSHPTAPDATTSLASECFDGQELRDAVRSRQQPTNAVRFRQQPTDAEHEQQQQQHGPIIGDLATCRITDFSYLFYNDFSFDESLSGWDTSSATTMASMFRDAYSFNGDVTDWDVGGVTDMSDMFSNARALEGNSMMHAALFASAFNVDISGWDVSAAGSVRKMFYNARSFSVALEWCLREGVDTADMFYESPGSLTIRCPTASPSASPSVIEELPIEVEEPPLVETAPETERAQASYDRTTFLISAVALFLLCVGVLVGLITYRANRRVEKDDAKKDDNTVCS